MNQPYAPDPTYEPLAIDLSSEREKHLLPAAHVCRSHGDKLIRARIFQRNLKLCTPRDSERFYSGVCEDYLAVNEGACQDLFIIRGDIFARSYELVEETNASLVSGGVRSWTISRG